MLVALTGVATVVHSDPGFPGYAMELTKHAATMAEVFARLGADPKAVLSFLDANQDPNQLVFQRMLFSKIVPNCKKLGLLDAGDGWLREQFTGLGIIEFEDGINAVDEYEFLDAVAADEAP